ncbi:MAG TPA: gliding motility-associated C-terminal domain-containing protein [Chitinophagaceae bacterium]|nr:gliding motility-associated C-terminal domain-containing protein [Chitinophagaceae bacterium]
MQKLLVLIILCFLAKSIQAQNSFSFNCTKNVTIGCTTSCIALNTTIPDIYSSTTSYTVDKVSATSCFRGYLSPAFPGTLVNLSGDDSYSPLIDITFPFSFYGSVYNRLTASTNGFLGFDTSKALAFSHYGILNSGGVLNATTGTPENIPSSLYDGAIIMGPYHDLDLNNGSNTQQIKYNVVGTAPYRKWIISYYKVPLYTTACLNLATNTHQIVLYETLGIVEVFIYDKEICVNWNNGRAMIGMQDINKSSAIMAPGRQATSVPWGSTGINESWRFVPASGQSLFKRVELYNISGNFIATGTTTPATNNLLNVSFGNICPPSTGETYIVKSFYKNPDNSANEIIGTDTINVSRGDTINERVASAGCAANATGVITVTSPIGANYEYSLDGVNWQPSNIFTVLPGTYLVRTRLIGTNCISSKSIIVNKVSLAASIITTFTECVGPPTGSITISPVNGTAPYQFSIDSGATFQASNVFINLAARTYRVVVKDALGCSYSIAVIIRELGPSFTVSVINPVCGGSLTGSITVNARGAAPFTYSINGLSRQTSNVFTDLPPGTYSITVYDATTCPTTSNVTISIGVSIKANENIKQPNCFGDNNGSITVNASSGVAPYQYALDSNSYQTNNVFNNLIAGNYTLHVKDAIGCIKDTVVTVLQPNPVKGTTIITPASTCFTNDGFISVKANGGVVPYTYSIDSGATYQANNFFKVPIGIYSIIIKDKNGCTSKIIDTVSAKNNRINVDAGPDKAICSGSSTTLGFTSNKPVDNFNWTPATGLDNATSATPVASPLDTTVYIVTARSLFCQGSDTIAVNVLHRPVANAGQDTTICNNTIAVLRGSATNISGNVNYLWAPAADVLTPTSPVTIAQPKTTRSHTYRLQVTDNYGCNFSAYDDVVVTMNEILRVSAGNDTVATIGFPHQLSGSGGTKYLWSPANVLDNPALQNPIATLQNDSRFILTVTDTFGCIATSSIFIKVYLGSTYYIPNAFTPNNDGINDVFRAIAPGIQKTMFFRVFNRLGQIMFETQDIKQGWNGTYKGVQQPGAIYVWVIKGLDVSGKSVELKGIVTLIR